MSDDDLLQWVGRRESQHQIISPQPVAALWATLDRLESAPGLGDPLPPLAHWLYFLSYVRRSDIAEDGHPYRGGFLPPVTLPRRMWAGSRITFHRDIEIGNDATKTSEIVSVVPKMGRSGPLVFVCVRHEIGDSNGVAITDEQDIVYRAEPGEQSAGTARTTASKSARWSRVVKPDPVLLFRYSALTFNGHRIHYDREYATVTEGYPGLVVHGPLIATLLVDFLSDLLPDSRLEKFTFRAVSPLFDGNDFSLSACPGEKEGEVHMWATAPDDGLAVDAFAVYR